MYSAGSRQLTSFSDSIRKIGPRCILCGQILLDQNRVKTHWRKSRPTAWRTASQEALRICGSLKSVFRSPCQFCNSKAKNLNLHSTQCASLFQVCAGMVLQAQNQESAAEADAKPPQARSSATVAAYKQFDVRASPLATAFRAGAATSRTPSGSIAPDISTFARQPEGQPGAHQVDTSTPAPGRAGSSGKSTQTTIRRFVTPSRGTAGADSSAASVSARPWTFRLQLLNPHQLCYSNSSVTAMIHVLNMVDSEDLRPLRVLCKQASDGGTALMLHSQLVMRSSVPRWVFNAEQKDAAELLLSFIQVSSATWSRWKSRAGGRIHQDHRLWRPNIFRSVHRARRRRSPRDPRRLPGGGSRLFVGPCLPESRNRLNRALHWENDKGRGRHFRGELQRNSRSSPPGSLQVESSRLERRAFKGVGAVFPGPEKVFAARDLNPERVQDVRLRARPAQSKARPPRIRPCQSHVPRSAILRRFGAGHPKDSGSLERDRGTRSYPVDKLRVHPSSPYAKIRSAARLSMPMTSS